MGLSINLEFANGDFERGFEQSEFVVTIAISNSPIRQIPVSLSPSPEIPELYQSWKNEYDDLVLRREKRGFKKNQVTHISPLDSQKCGEQAKALRFHLDKWLEQGKRI